MFLDAVAFFFVVLAFATFSITSLYGCWMYVYRDGRANYKPSSVLREKILVLKRWGGWCAIFLLEVLLLC